MVKRWVRWYVSIYVAILAGFLILCFIVAHDWRCCAYAEPQIAFDAASWKAYSDKGRGEAPPSKCFTKLFVSPSTRQLMIRDLVRNHLPGRSLTEIETLLGPGRPSAGSWFSNWQLVYYVGEYQPDATVPIDVDGEWILIGLDANERFEAWSMASQRDWRRIVGPESNQTFQDQDQRMPL